jgi:hypothetical protein
MLKGRASSLASQLPQGFVLFRDDEHYTDHCGSEPAREGVRSDNVDVECKGLFASRLACMFRLEGVGGTKSSIPTLASTDRGRLLVPPLLPKAPIRNSSVKPTIEASQRKGKPQQALKP